MFNLCLKMNKIAFSHTIFIPCLFILLLLFQENKKWQYFFFHILKSSMIHQSCRSSSDSIKNNTAMIPYDLENPIDHADEDNGADCEVPEELARLLRQEEKVIQPHQEAIEVINLGNEEVKKEIKIGAALRDEEKKGLIELLQEYVDVFAWSYEDMPGLDTDIVVHRLPLKPECSPVK